MKDIEAEIKDTIVALADIADEEFNSEYKKCENEFKDLDFSKIGNIESFVFKREQMLYQHCKKYFNTFKISKQNKDRLCEFVLKINMLSYNIEKIVDMNAGCTSDMSSWILRQYMNNLLEKEIEKIPDRLSIENRFWHPNFGTIEDYFDLIDGLLDLYYGFNEKYIKAYQKLIMKKQETQKQIEVENELMITYKEYFLKFVEECKESFPLDLYERITNKYYTFSFMRFIVFEYTKNQPIKKDYFIETMLNVYNSYFKK